MSLTVSAGIASLLGAAADAADLAPSGLPPFPPAVIVPEPVPVPVPVPPPLIVNVPVEIPLPAFLAPPPPPPPPSPTLFSSPVAFPPPPPHRVRSRDPDRAEADFYGYTGVPRPPRPPLGYIPRVGLD